MWRSNSARISGLGIFVLPKRLALAEIDCKRAFLRDGFPSKLLPATSP